MWVRQQALAGPVVHSTVAARGLSLGHRGAFRSAQVRKPPRMVVAPPKGFKVQGGAGSESSSHV